MIHILVDSGSDYAVSTAQENGITVLPITLTIAEQEYRGGIDLTCDELYERVEASGDFPKTSQIPPHIFAATFEQLVARGDDVIMITLSSEFSGTYQSACIAQAMVGSDRVHIIDSLTASCPIRILADYAYALCESGMSASQIVNNLEQIKSRLHLVAALDTLEYLQRGGRIPKAAARLGDAAKLKPVISVLPDGISLIGACLGQKKALDSVMKALAKTGVDSSFPVYSIYSQGTKTCEKLEKRLKEQGVAVTERLQIGCVIGAHIGPGACGVVYVEP